MNQESGDIYEEFVEYSDVKLKSKAQYADPKVSELT
jgi:hypothetical protein